MASATSNRLIGFLPLLAFLSAWSIQLMYFLWYDSRLFFTFNFNIVSIILLGVLAYTCGYFFVKIVPLASVFKIGNARSLPPSKASTSKMMNITAMMSFLVIAMNILIPFYQGFDLSVAREMALENWNDGSAVARINAVIINITITFSIMVIIDKIDTSKKFPIGLVLIFIILTIAAYSRAHLLLGLSIISIKWLSVSRYKLSYILFVLLLFVALFSVLSVFASVGSAGRSSGIEDIAKSIEVYAFGGVAGFEFFYNTGHPTYNAALTVPRFMYSIFPGLGITPPSYFPFVDTTPPINIFSALYPPFHDFGSVGVSVLFFIYGSLSCIVANAFQEKSSRLTCLLTGFALYAALMSPFDDQFIRGLTILILMLFGVMIYRIIYRIMEDGLL